MLDGDALDHVFTHVGSNHHAHLPVWLTCKAFGERRPHGALETSANAMCASPSLFRWAMTMGLEPRHLQAKRLTGDGATAVLNAMRPKMVKKSTESHTASDTVQQIRFGSVIDQLRSHKERRVKANAIKTATALLKQLTKMDPADLVDEASLDACIDFVWQCTTGRPCKAFYPNAAEVLSKIMRHLAETDAHAEFGRVLARILKHPLSFVRYEVLDAACDVSAAGLIYHAAAIADFLSVASCNRDMDRAVRFLDQLEPGVLRLYSTQVVGLLFRVTEMGVPEALRLLRQLEPSDIAVHEEIFLQKMRSHHWCQRMIAVSAMGDVGQPALAQQAGAVRRLLRDPVCLVRCRALETMGKLPVEDALNYIDEIAAMMSDEHSHVRSAAADVLGMFDAVNIEPHAGALAKLLGDGELWTRSSAMTTLRKLLSAQTQEYATLTVPDICKCKVCSRDRFLEAAQEVRQMTGYDD